MPMQMDTSIGDTDSSTGTSDAVPADEIKRLTELARSRSSGSRRSYATRPTYAPAFARPSVLPNDPSTSSTSIRRPVSQESGAFNPYAPFVPAEGMSPGDAQARGLTDQSGLSDPSSIYYDRSQGGGQAQGSPSLPGQQDPRSMAAAYHNLLDSVAKQHLNSTPSIGGGQPPANGSQLPYFASGQQPGQPQGQQGGTDPKQAFQSLLHSVAVQHGGTPPSEGGQQPQSTVGTATSGPEFEARSKAYWDIQDKKDIVKPKSSSSNKSTKDDIPPPPRLPANADKDQIEQFKSEHQAWVDDVKFHRLHDAIVNGGHSNSKQRLEMAAVKAQSTVLEKDLEDAKNKLERSKGWGNSEGDVKLRVAVDKAQSTFDEVKARRNKLMDAILSIEGEEEDATQGDNTNKKGGGMITAITEEEIKALEKNTRFIGPDGKVWVRHGE